MGPETKQLLMVVTAAGKRLALDQDRWRSRAAAVRAGRGHQAGDNRRRKRRTGRDAEADRKDDNFTIKHGRVFNLHV